jgi:predicted RNA methylase
MLIGPVAVASVVFALGAAMTPAQVPEARRPDIGYAPTPLAVVDAMLQAAAVTANDVVYDLGSGDGRVVIMAAAKYGARGVGIEIDPALVKSARQAAIENGVADRVSFVEGDMFSADISPATVVTLFLWPSVNTRLETKLRFELRPGTRIVSNTFGIGHWRPDETTRGVAGSDVLLWRVPRAPARVPDVPFEPTSDAVVREMLRFAQVTADDVVYDLGSGDGRIPIVAAETYGAKAVGVELDPRLIEISRQVAADVQLGGTVRFTEGDLFATDLSSATVVTLALSPEVNAKLEPKLKKELRPGARIVSHRDPVGAWSPDRVMKASDGTDLLLYIVRDR